jgi:hypothetical protein
MKAKKKLYVAALGVAAIFAGWALFFHFYPVQELVDRIGIQNTYLAAFLLALIGGFSSVTGTSLYAALIALSHSGMNPIILGLVGGLGLFASDTIFYLIMVKVRSLIQKVTNRWERLFRRMWKWFYVMPDWVVYFGIYLYAAFAPLPNDILLAVLALSSYSYRQFLLFLFLGDLTMTLILTHIGSASIL